MSISRMVSLMLLVSACQQHVYVAGTTSDLENIKAKATGVPGIAGQVVLDGDKGLHCSGEWKHAAFGIGLGSLQCSNGQQGTFFYSKEGKGGGRIGDREFAFTFQPIVN